MPPSTRSDPAVEAARFRTDDVRLGYVSGVFGTRGEVRLFLYNPHSDLFDRPREVVLVTADGRRRRARMRSRPGAGKRILGQLEGITDPEAARALIGAELVLPAAELPELEPGTWYHHELYGTPVRSRSGELVGELAEIYESATDAAPDIWVVRGSGGERFIPATRAVVLHVEPGHGIVVADEAAEPPIEDGN